MKKNNFKYIRKMILLLLKIMLGLFLFWVGIIIMCFFPFLYRFGKFTTKTKENILDHSFDGSLKDGVKNILTGDAIFFAKGTKDVVEKIEKPLNKQKLKAQGRRVLNRGLTVYGEMYHPDDNDFSYLKKWKKFFK